MSPRSFVCLAGLTLLAFTTACGGGGGGGRSTPPPPPTPPQASLTYTPASSSPQDSFSLVRSNMGATELLLELQANSVSDVYGLSFDLAFPGNLLRFEEATEGDWLGNSGSVQTSFLAEVVSGAVVAGLTRLGTVSGRTGSGSLLTLRFTAIGSGSGTFQFTDIQVTDGSGGTAAIVWSAGSVSVQL